MIKNYGVDCLISGKISAICFLRDINEINSVDKKYLFTERDIVKIMIMTYIIEKSQRVLNNTTISIFEGDLSVYIQADDTSDC